VVDCPPLPDPVYVDREMWEKIVLNLLSNAFKHTFEGSIQLVLRWRTDHAELAVADSGIGIPAAELPRLFERFHRVKGAKSRTHEGRELASPSCMNWCPCMGGPCVLKVGKERADLYGLRPKQVSPICRRST